jgi:hypothetical protein
MAVLHAGRVCLSDAFRATMGRPAATMIWPSARHQPASTSKMRLPMKPSGPTPRSSRPSRLRGMTVWSNGDARRPVSRREPLDQVEGVLVADVDVQP